MITSVRFILSYDFKIRILSPAKWTYLISMKIYTVVTDVVNDITFSHESVTAKTQSGWTFHRIRYTPVFCPGALLELCYCHSLIGNFTTFPVIYNMCGLLVEERFTA